MSDDPTNDADVRARQAADAEALAAWRVVGVVAIWSVLAAVRPPDSPAIALPIDAWLGVAAMWSLWRADRARPAFLSPQSWTRVLALPPMLGIILTLKDILALVHSG